MTNAAAELAARTKQNETDIEVLTALLVAGGGGGGATDHGALTGLSDDDHAQYHNDARGDARYQPLSLDLTLISALVTRAFGRSLLTLNNAAELTALGDVATALLNGLAPASGGGTTNFLRADMTWAAPLGGGGSLDDVLAVEALL